MVLLHLIFILNQNEGKAVPRCAHRSVIWVKGLHTAGAGACVGRMHLPDDPERPVPDGPVGLHVQLRLQVVPVVVRFDRSGLDLARDLARGRGRRRRPGSLPRGGGREVGLLLDRVQGGGGGARVLQVMLAHVVVVVVIVVVVVVVVRLHVGGREVRELVVMLVVGGHRRGAAVVSGHHFRNMCSRGAAKSHSLMTNSKV